MGSKPGQTHLRQLAVKCSNDYVKELDMLMGVSLFLSFPQLFFQFNETSLLLISSVEFLNTMCLGLSDW
jgi:hypothetical protein